MMHTGLNFLSRLPPSLRHNSLLQFSSITCNQQCRRSLQRNTLQRFSTIIRRQQAEPRIVKPTRTSPTNAPPAAQPFKPRPSLAQASSGLANDLTADGPILLYNAPKHGLFYLMSYLCGGTLILGCTLVAQDVLKERTDRPPLSWTVKALSAVQVLLVTSIGTVFVLAPTKLIRSIKLMPSVTSAAGPSFRFEIRRAVPFLKPDVLDTPLTNVSISRHVVGEDISPLSVPMEQAQAFTEKYSSSKKAKEATPGVPVAPQAGVFKAFKRDVRRMFLRDQMAYVNVGNNGLFKMDMQGCQVLDHGRPLMSLTTVDTQKRNLFARLQAVIGK